MQLSKNQAITISPLERRERYAAVVTMVSSNGKSLLLKTAEQVPVRSNGMLLAVTDVLPLLRGAETDLICEDFFGGHWILEPPDNN